MIQQVNELSVNDEIKKLEDTRKSLPRILSPYAVTDLVTRHSKNNIIQLTNSLVNDLINQELYLVAYDYETSESPDLMNIVRVSVNDHYTKYHRIIHRLKKIKYEINHKFLYQRTPDQKYKLNVFDLMYGFESADSTDTLYILKNTETDLETDQKTDTAYHAINADFVMDIKSAPRISFFVKSPTDPKIMVPVEKMFYKGLFVDHSFNDIYRTMEKQLIIPVY